MRDIQVDRRCVFIDDLEIPAQIGIHPHELLSTQPLLIDLELDIRSDITPKDDDIGEVVDYQAIVDKVIALTTGGHVNLVETLAEKIARHLLEDKRIIEVFIRLSKPQALKKARSAGCELRVRRTNLDP